jgi:hypothetical protein
MSGPVDVLAHAVTRLRVKHPDHATDAANNAAAIALHEYTAAVAELIEVSRVLLTYRVGEYPTRGDLRDNDASRAQLDALATVLARVGGAS